MKLYRFKNMFRFAFIIMAVCTLGSCIKDNYETGGLTGTEEKEVTISIAVPYPQIQTRGLATGDEDMINSVELLVYDAAGNFDYISHGQDITNTGSLTNQKSFQVVLKKGTPEITMLANCRQIIQQIYPGGIPVGTPRATLESSLTLAVTGKWLADPSASGYLDIPMWGDIGQVDITSSTDALGGAAKIYELHRMLASVEIKTSLTDPSVFDLTSVRVYNVETEGAVVPANKANFNTTPTIPSGSTRSKGPLVYDSSTITSDASGDYSVGEIYLLEALAGSKATHPDHPCLVLGGKYKGGKELFYRVDFQSNQTYLNILRNHRYQVVITGVNDKGFETPDEAYESFPVGIESQVIGWSTGSGSDISVGGKYILKVSTDELIFNPAGGTQVMYVYTDHPDGWDFVQKTPLPSWIRLSTTHGNPNVYTEVRVEVDDYDQDGPRVYEIPVVVDNVEKGIRFAQLGKNDAAIEIFATPTQILFPKGPSEPAKIQVSTYPFNLPLYYTWSGDAFDWDVYPTDGVAVNEVSIQPKANNTGSIRSGILTITARDSGGQMATCLIYISHADKMTGLEYTLNNPYSHLPGTYDFNVTSTVGWQVNTVSPSTEWIARFTGLQTATPSGQTYQFDLAGNPTYAAREIEVTLYSPDNGESTTAIFEQQATPPVLSALDGTQQLEVLLPTEAGQTVKFRILTNVPWRLSSDMDFSTPATLNSQYLSSYNNSSTPYPVTQPIWTPETIEFEYKTNEYDWVSATPRGGSTKTVGDGNNLWINNTDHNKWLYLKLSRVVPHLARLTSATSGSNIKSTYNNTSPGVTWPVMRSDENGWMQWFPAGETLITTIRLATNTSCTIWTSLDPGTRVTYKRAENSAFSTSVVVNTTTLVIPENKTGNTRNFTLYIEKEDGDIVEIPSIQHGENPAFTYTVECEDGTVPLDQYLNTHNNLFPTGGLVVNVTATGFEHGVYIMGLMDGELQELQAVKNKKKVTTNGGSIRYTVRPNPGGTGQNRAYGLTYASVHPSVNRTGTDGAMQQESNFPRSPYRTIQQDYKSYKLTGTTGRVIARESLYDRTTSANNYYYEPYSTAWETAAGIDGYATTTLNDLMNYATRPDFIGNPRSCAAYSEWDDGGKTWRLPTLPELQEMFNRRFEIGGFYSDGAPGANYYYWAIDNNGNNASMVNFGTHNPGHEYTQFKTLPARVRCVRDE